MTLVIPDKDALEFVIRELYKKRNDGLDFITARNGVMCKEVADFLALILEEWHGQEQPSSVPPPMNGTAEKGA